MGLFDKDTLEGLLNTTKGAVKAASEKIAQTAAETSSQIKTHSEEAKKSKQAVEGAVARYGFTYNGGLAKYPKKKVGEIGLNVMEDRFYLKPSNTADDWFEEMTIPYNRIKSLEVVERTISNTEWLLSSSSSDMKSMEQKNNIEISYIDADDKSQLLRLEMLTGVSIYGQAKKCVEFMDVLRQNEVLEKFMKEEKKEASASPENDVLNQIEKLATLKEKGILSDEEYNQKKKELLKKL